jgi:hypothetical protein
MTAFDWDGARITGVPGLDLFHMHAYLAFALDGTMRDHRFRASHARHEAGRLGATRQAATDRYAQALELSDLTIRAVRAFAWMDLCIEEAEATPERDRRAQIGTDRSLFALWDYDTRRAVS